MVKYFYNTHLFRFKSILFYKMSSEETMSTGSIPTTTTNTPTTGAESTQQNLPQKRPQYKRVAPIIKNAFRAQEVVEPPKKIAPVDLDESVDEYNDGDNSDYEESTNIINTTVTSCPGCYNCNWTGYSTNEPEKCKLYM